MKTTKKAHIWIMAALLLFLLMCAACGQAGDAAGEAAVQNGAIAAGAGEAAQGSAAVAVVKTAPDTVRVSFTDEILNTMTDRNEIRIRFYYDDSRNAGYELSSSPSYWTVSTIGEAGQNLAEGSEFQKNGTIWKWEIPSPDWYQKIADCSYYEVMFSDWDDPDGAKTLSEGSLIVTEAGQESAEKESKAEDPAVTALLYEDEADREYLAPDTDDFRVIVYEIPEISVIYNYGIWTDTYGMPVAYILFPSGEEKAAGCKYVEVTSFDKESGKNILRSKLVFENEEDALHPYVANSEEFWYYFEDYSGEYGVIPDDFDEDTAIRMICDEFIPDPARNGENAQTIRKGNIWYKVYDDDNRQFPLDAFAGLYLYPNTSDYAARNTDENGFHSFTDMYEHLADGQVSPEREAKVTIYYSRPEDHGKTNGPSLTLQDVEAMLNNPGDDTYFKPASSDHVYVVEYVNDLDSRIILASFDQNGKLIQSVTREERKDTNGFGNTILQEYQSLSPDKKVLYLDDYALFSAQGDASYTDRSKEQYLEEWAQEYEYNFDSTLQIIEGKN